jgi:hypothetical protein
VASSPPTHVVCPDEQLFMQVVAHMALGDVPEHDVFPVHAFIDAT